MTPQQQYAIGKLVELGWSPVAAAGIVGNLTNEVGPALDPTRSHDGGTGYGIAGWRDPSPGQGRWTNLRNFASERGMPVDSVDTQLAFLDHELKTTEKSVGARLKAATDPLRAGATFIDFERPQGWKRGDPTGALGYDNRRNEAARLFAAYGAPQQRRAPLNGGTVETAALPPVEDEADLPAAAQPTSQDGEDPYAAFSTLIDGTKESGDPYASFSSSVEPPSKEAKLQQSNGPEEGVSLDNVVRSVARGIPVLGGAMDNIAAAGDAATHAVLGRGSDAPSFGERYEQNLKAEQGRDEAYDRQHPIASTAGQIAGGVLGTAPLVVAAPTLMGAKGASLGTKALMGSTSGAALGAADSAVRSGGDASDTMWGGGAGLVGGALGPVVGRAIGKGAQTVSDSLGMSRVGAAARASAPTLENLDDQARALYQRAREAGVTVKPDAYHGFLINLAGTLKEKGFDAALHPKAAAAVSRMARSAGEAPSLEDLEILRRVAGAAGASIEPDERRIGSIIKDSLDDWIDALKPNNVAAGNAREGFSSLKAARTLWGQKRKGEIVEGIVENAKNAASGYENGLRMGFRSLAKNQKAMRGFSDVERRAIHSVARGTPLANVLKLLGKGAPTGVVSLGMSGGAGYVLGGPIGAAIALAAGAMGRKGSEILTERAAETAGALMRQGRAAQNAIPALTAVNRGAIDRGVQSALVGLVPSINAHR